MKLYDIYIFIVNKLIYININLKIEKKINK